MTAKTFIQKVISMSAIYLLIHIPIVIGAIYGVTLLVIYTPFGRLILQTSDAMQTGIATGYAIGISYTSYRLAIGLTGLWVEGKK